KPLGQHLLGFVLVRLLCALAKRPAMTVILNPPHGRIVSPVETAFSFRFHCSSLRLFLAQRAITALRAISLRSAPESFVSRIFAPFLPILDNSEAERLVALAFPPLLPRTTAF